jgi:hypothetical protein
MRSDIEWVARHQNLWPKKQSKSGRFLDWCARIPLVGRLVTRVELPPSVEAYGHAERQARIAAEVNRLKRQAGVSDRARRKRRHQR